MLPLDIKILARYYPGNVAMQSAYELSLRKGTSSKELLDSQNPGSPDVCGTIKNPYACVAEPSVSTLTSFAASNTLAEDHGPPEAADSLNTCGPCGV